MTMSFWVIGRLLRAPATKQPHSDLADGTIAPHERCVALLTASGLKDPGPIETALPEPPLVSGGLTELLAALKNAYGFTHG